MAVAKRRKRGGTPKVVRVAIIGGGCSGLAAAWELSKRPEYQVSVFERSWRLGGKGASGRAPDGRILEHGLHLWLGFYDNAFRMIRECYDEVRKRGWGPTADHAGRLAHGSFDEAFVAEPHIGVTGWDATGRQTVWSGHLPPAKGLPGDPIVAESNPFTLANYLLRCIDLLKTLMLSVIAPTSEQVPGRPRPGSRSAVDERIDLDFSFDPRTAPELLIRRVADQVRAGTLTAAAAMLQVAAIVEKMLQDFHHLPQIPGSTLNLLQALASQTRRQLEDVVAIDPALRWKSEIIDIVMTIAVGLYRERVLLEKDGLDVLNDHDYREWLLKHGATRSALNSRFITGIYDLVFAYEGGNRDRPRLAAGVALRGALRMFFTYRGAMFWRMRSGMGDAVFAPLYRVLSLGDREHGHATLHPVQFHFQHELTGITLESSDAGPFVSRLVFSAPATSRNAVDPLDHLGGWPARAPTATAARRRRKVLRVEKEFDAVIFAMGLDDFASLAQPTDQWIAHAPERWRAALRTPGQTVATRSAQVWLKHSLDELGWFRGTGIVSALRSRADGEMPFDTWADMTHTLGSERDWRDMGNSGAPRDERTLRVSQLRPDTTAQARSVAYFCGVAADGTAKGSRSAQGVTTATVEQAVAAMRHLWPSVPQSPKRASAAQVAPPHMQVNATGSDRYSLSLPGTIADRISPLDGSVLNATVAGDWTACGLDAGCIEGAVISGRLAAHAITGGQPPLDDIIGYDHP
jgi:uncharacterized protein with NAD-binding domain and iron-sulfur cluster